MDNVKFDLELRLSEDGDGRTVAGLAVPYEKISYQVPNAAGEMFMRGSLNKTAKDLMGSKRKLKIFKSHEHNTALGFATVLDPSHPDGLWVEMRIADTDAGNAALKEIREGVLDEISVGFRAIRETRNGDGVREIREAALGEISLCPLGAYGDQGSRVLAMRETFDPYRLPKAPTVPGWLLN
jgi:HK97 family phage prohead protease